MVRSSHVGTNLGKESEEWVIHLGLGQSGVPIESLSEEAMKKIIRRTLKLPDLELEILHTNRWHIDGLHASQVQTRRIFLAGDAAHRHPPITGLGLDTAIGDAHILAWKLAAVLKDGADRSLLHTYEPERLPVGKRVVEWAIFGFMNLRVIDSAVGLLPGGEPLLTQNEKIFREVVSDTFQGQVRRASIQHALKSQRVETGAHDLEIGHIYPAGALLADGTEPPLSIRKDFFTFRPLVRVTVCLKCGCAGREKDPLTSFWMTKARGCYSLTTVTALLNGKEWQRKRDNNLDSGFR